MKNDNRITVGLSDQDAPMQAIPSDDSVQAQYVVCKGATCSCDGNPSAKGTLMVTSQKKYSINDKGADKLVATVEDTAFEEGVSPFITCSYKKGTDKTCTYAPQGNWIVPNNTKFPEVAGKAILTETGTLCCTLGGTLTFMTHGQTVDVDNDEVQEVEDAFVAMRVINVLLSYEELPLEEQKYPEEYVSDVAQLECIPSEDVVLTPMSEGNTRAFYVLKGQFVEFSATTKVNTADPHKRRGENISWGLTEILENGVFTAGQSSISKTYKLPPTDQEKVFYQGYKRVANPFGFVFTKSGHYIIDASSREKMAGTTWSYYKDQYCYIQVVDQASILALRLNVVDQAILVGEEVILTVISDLPLSPAVLNTLTIVVCSVAKTGEESLEYIYRDAVIESINGSKRYTQTANKLEAKFKCVNSGLFRIKVLQDGQELMAFTQTIEVVGDKVLAIESVEGRIRRGSIAVFRAILKRGGRLDTAKIKWRLRSPKGRTYEVSEVGVTHEFEFKEVGTYTLQCFYGNQIEKVEKKIEVLDNEIEGVTLRNAVVKEEGKNYAVFVNQGIVININMPLDYSYEAVIPDISAWSSVLNFHTSKEEAFAYIAQSKSKKDPLLLYGISYMSKGANQIKGTIKIGNRITKIIGATPVYFTGSTAELSLTLADEGMYFLSIQLGQSAPVEVVLNSCKGKIKQWSFHDGKHKTTRLGYKQIFGIAATVEGWANKKGKLHFWWDNRTNGGTILKYFQTDATIEKERHHLIYSQDVTFDRNGVLNKTIGVDSAFWKNLQQVVDQQQAKDKIFNFYFTLSEVEVPCENQNEAVYHTEFRKGHVFPNQSMSSGSYAILVDQPYCVGHFVDKDKKGLEAIVQYTDQTSIALHLYKGFERKTDQTIYEIHLYENQIGEDKFIECYNVVGHETEIVNYIQLPTSSAVYGSSTHEQDKGNKKNPRLFYFILYQWRGEHQEEFNQLKGQPPKRRSTCSAGSLLAPIRMYPENLGVRYKNDDSIIELEDEDEGKYITALKNKKADQKQKQVLNQERMGTALKGITPGSKSFNQTVDPFVQIHEQLEQKIKAIDLEIKTLSEYKARIKRNNAKINAEKKGVKNYFKQLKLAIDPIFNEVQNRNKKRVPVKVEVGNAMQNTSSTNKVGCPNCRAVVTPEQLKTIFPDATPDALKQVAATYTKYMEYFSLDTCRKKAYFFAAASVEAGTSILGRYNSTEEDLYYTRLSLLRNFPSTFFSGGMVYNAESKKKVWQSDVYSAQSGDSNYQKHNWYATVNRGDKTLYIQIEDDKKGYENRIFKSKALWEKVVYFDSFEGVRREKSKAIAGFIYKDKNGNTSEEDGVNYRGSGLIQITGRGVFDEVQSEIKDVINKEITTDIRTKSGSDHVRDTLEIGTLAGMGYFAMMKLNWLINKLPRNEESDINTEVLEVWTAIGNNTFDDSYAKKTKSYTNKASSAFYVPACTAHKRITPSSVSEEEIITYEMYYHALETDRYVKKIIPKEGNNKSPDYRKYVYIDKNNKRHELCVLRVKMIPKVSYTRTVDAKGRIHTSDPKDMIEMIENIMQFTGYDEGGDAVDRLVVKFREDRSQEYKRYGINPDFLASLLGAMCYMNCDYVSFNGASSYKGYPEPSKEHLNGGICDLGYVPKNRNLHSGGLVVKDSDVEKQIEFNDALYRYGFARGENQMFSFEFEYKGDHKFLLNHCKIMAGHKDHLHVRGLDYNLMIVEQRK
ncbi:PAAR-like protein [Myroides sp. TSA_177.3]|uniref:PAAR-like protein n=1 Tax=Myroides sp. TSA_177.3 TaxID=3415650 RepID=UPI0040463350